MVNHPKIYTCIVWSIKISVVHYCSMNITALETLSWPPFNPFPGAPTDTAPVLQAESVFVKKTKPGLSSYVDDPKKAVTGSIDRLLCGSIVVPPKEMVRIGHHCAKEIWSQLRFWDRSCASLSLNPSDLCCFDFVQKLHTVLSPGCFGEGWGNSMLKAVWWRAMPSLEWVLWKST